METERIEVGGYTFDVNREKAQGWHVFQLMRKAQTAEGDFAKMDIALEIACYITGMDQGSFVEACGGEDASPIKIMETAAELMTRALPKN